MRWETQEAGGAAAELALPIMWEAGHYYKAKGPTSWSRAGWDILSRHVGPRDSRLLFIDDVHRLDDVHESERFLETISFDPTPEPTHQVHESAVLDHAHEALAVLKDKNMPRRRRARAKGKSWQCSGFRLITENGEPLCLFYDLGLTWYKRSLGFKKAVNVVPVFYEEEQRRLLRLVRKAMPEFELRVILHDEYGRWRELNGEI